MNTSRPGWGLWVGLVLAVLGLVFAVSWRGDPDPGPRGKPTRRSGDPASGPAPLRGTGPVAPPLTPASPGPGAVGITDDLRAAIESGDEGRAQAAAALLRRRLRTDPAAWKEATSLLLADSTSPALREALAFVLGTIVSPDPDPVLREALAKFGASASFARAAMLAFGAVREPEDDDEVFALADRPNGVLGPGGLGITVGREVAEPGVREAIARGLGRSEPEVRRAAALALRGSLGSVDARAAFLGALAGETEDAVAQELGEGLVDASRRLGDPVERTALLGGVLRRAAEDPFDGLRFRVEDDLAAAHLGPAERTALADLAALSRPFGTRAFALTTLAGAGAAGDVAAVSLVRPLLATALGSDGDPAVRDLAARLLGTLPADDGTNAVLATAATRDAAWNVRYTALDSAVKLGVPDADRLLDSATRDADPHVVELARDLIDSRR